VRTLLLVDDDPDLRAMLRYLIQSTTSFEIVAEAGDGLEAIAMAEKHRPDVVVMDVQMPNLDGIEATRRIKDSWPGVTVLGLTAFGDYPELMLAAGAARCLLKTDTYGSLSQVLNRLQDDDESGSTWYS
jgi:DNA-binding NarL/FixJ family response regulator